MVQLLMGIAVSLFVGGKTAQAAALKMEAARWSNGDPTFKATLVELEVLLSPGELKQLEGIAQAEQFQIIKRAMDRHTQAMNT